MLGERNLPRNDLCLLSEHQTQIPVIKEEVVEWKRVWGHIIPAMSLGSSFKFLVHVLRSCALFYFFILQGRSWWSSFGRNRIMKRKTTFLMIKWTQKIIWSEFRKLLIWRWYKSRIEKGRPKYNKIYSSCKLRVVSDLWEIQMIKYFIEIKSSQRKKVMLKLVRAHAVIKNSFFRN